MKVPLSWVREFVNVTASAEEIGTLMGVRGLALEGLEPHGDDVVMDFDVTANRPDCMSVVGIARIYQQYAVSDKVGEWTGMDYNSNGFELGLSDVQKR